jgi:hypothetical protein
MIPSNQKNRKARINLKCPGCGMDLSKGRGEGFVLDSDTYCCQGCANGTGCTCLVPVRKTKKTFNRPGSLGHRNSENTVRDHNQNQEVNTSGKVFGKRKPTRKAPPQQTRRGARLASGEKIARSQDEVRPSTREQARGRSEFLGSLAKRRIGRDQPIPRVSRTGTKSK